MKNFKNKIVSCTISLIAMIGVVSSCSSANAGWAIPCQKFNVTCAEDFKDILFKDGPFSYDIPKSTIKDGKTYYLCQIWWDHVANEDINSIQYEGDVTKFSNLRYWYTKSHYFGKDKSMSEFEVKRKCIELRNHGKSTHLIYSTNGIIPNPYTPCECVIAFEVR